MLAALLIVFREVLEAGLIVGVVLAASEGAPRRGRWIAGGIAAGAVGAGVLALFAGQIAGLFAGAGQDLFNAAVLAAAVVMLTWHLLWIGRRGAQEAREMRQLGGAVRAGERTLPAMAVVVAAAVLREGSEVVLFLFGIAAPGETGPWVIAAGGVLGLGLGVAAAWALYRGLLAIPTRRLFAVTNTLIALLAAGMAGQAASLLARAGLIPALGDQIWDTSAILRDDSLIGRALHALVGYSDRPMGVQLLAWSALLLSLAIASRWLDGADRRRLARVANRPGSTRAA
jgi:high-affinity iron transporter